MSNATLRDTGNDNISIDENYYEFLYIATGQITTRFDLDGVVGHEICFG